MKGRTKHESRASVHGLWITTALLVVGVAFGGWWVLRPDAPLPNLTAAPHSAAQRTAFAHAVRDAVQGQPGPIANVAIPYLPSTARGLAYVALRVSGERAADAWGDGTTPVDALSDALGAASAELDEPERALVDTVEVSVAGAVVARASLGDNVDRGILGMSVRRTDGQLTHFAPTRMIADNTSFERALDGLEEDGLIDATRRPADAVELFEATQMLIDLDEASVTPLIRGNEVVDAADVSTSGTEALTTGMADWLVRQLGDDGRMVYSYFPSRGSESQTNNMIRQWMATIALQRIVDERRDEALAERVQGNIRYNLDLAYRDENGFGLVADPDGDVKLGAIALAALALSQSPDRSLFADEEAALRRTVDHLWQSDGSFETFYLPAGRSDNQNFYPGEALLLWAVTLEDELDADLLDRFMRSFDYYRGWHRAQRNPAFVPWHTMAYETVWRITGDPELRDFVFEMNDWLLNMQQWSEAPAPDAAGRFHEPDRPDFGPPHASSDGVYLEGLIAAYRLADEVRDEARTEAYRTAIARGIRHLMQLQFADSVDMYYVSKRDSVAGGVRTTVYDNVIRVDNVQHGLLAMMDVLHEFGADDYAIDNP